MHQHIIQPTSVPSNSKALIDNLFSNIPDSVSGSLIATVSDHHPQFVLTSSIFFNLSLGRESNIHEKDWANFDQENFILDYLAKDWNSIIKMEQASVNLSFQSFLGKINFILDKFPPIKKVSKHKLKLKSKPWITTDVQKSISKNKVYS